jgi:hypothetical protein
MIRRRPVVRGLLTSAVVAALALPAAPSAAAEAVHVLVLRENGAGSAATAQKYIDELVVRFAAVNGWSAAAGAYHTKRKPALAYIASARPHFGFLSLGAFLALRGGHGLRVVGQADIRGGGGEQYYLLSKTATDLAGCKGKKLATNHAEDAKFVDKVVLAGAAKLADFELVATTRPVQTVKTVIKGEADCALVDDAQMADLANIEGGKELKPVWFSARLPPMVVVAFEHAPAGEVKAFKQQLSAVCDGDGKQTCDAAGIKSLRAADDSAYKAVVDAYGK